MQWHFYCYTHARTKLFTEHNANVEENVTYMEGAWQCIPHNATFFYHQSLCSPLVTLVTGHSPDCFVQRNHPVVQDLSQLQRPNIRAFHEVGEGKAETLVDGITFGEYLHCLVCSLVVCIGQQVHTLNKVRKDQTRYVYNYLCFWFNWQNHYKCIAQLGVWLLKYDFVFILYLLIML